ncbi:hypothetical protein NDU88_003128 [Pleurodeles waltl]|uniref:Uncharacterized protein n=1 Tax=Pleurodeles waltl TaxID=8319 RepID=A0AAV7NNV2_PLEWA|nr:hypothetical protein NDU88_003128 [Pleurodeles waltl]
MADDLSPLSISVILGRARAPGIGTRSDVTVPWPRRYFRVHDSFKVLRERTPRCLAVRRSRRVGPQSGPATGLVNTRLVPLRLATERALTRGLLQYMGIIYIDAF